MSDRADTPVDALGRPLDAGSPTATRAGPAKPAPARPGIGVSSTVLRRFVDRGSGGAGIVFGALIVAAGLVLFGLLMRPQPGVGLPVAPQGSGSGSGGLSGPGGSAIDPPALITGVTIDSPRDGQAVATKEVTVIGLAPPGLTVTRDVSFGFDQHATADGTGHWAINVSLEDGENNLVFRIGDDRSTERRLRVIYKPPQAP